MIKIKYITFFLFFILSFELFTQNKPETIIEKVKSELNKIKDFEAELNVKIDISFVNAPDAKGKVYFKAPNKNKIDIKGFSLLPKQGTGNFIAELFERKDLNFIYINEETINSTKCKVIKVIPTESNSDLVLSTLWIDYQRGIVLKAENTTRNNGSFVVNVDYIFVENKYWVPSKVEISVDIQNFNMPKSMTFEKNKKNESNNQKNVKGRVIINYWNYKINKGISDSVFK